MAKQIEAETLREWLDAQQPVTVLDVRTDDDRAQWAIPGSLHVNAYEALRDGQPGALADTPLPSDRPVVTICNAGRLSQTAADILSARGFDARSLAGGMKAWSLAWNAASDAAVFTGDTLFTNGVGRPDLHADPEAARLKYVLKIGPFRPTYWPAVRAGGLTMMDSIPSRYQLRVKQRQRVVEFAEDHGFRAAARHFGLARRTVRTWCRRWAADREQGLVPRYPARRRRRVSDGIVELARVARTEYR